MQHTSLQQDLAGKNDDQTTDTKTFVYSSHVFCRGKRKTSVVKALVAS